MTWKAIRVASHICHQALRLLRLLYYNLTCFGFYRPWPWTTTIYGRIRFLHRPCRVSLGEKCRIGDDAYFATTLYSSIQLGRCVTVNVGCVFVAIERIEVGDNTAIAEYVSIRDQAHLIAEGHGIREQGYDVAPVQIGRNVWIGRGAFIGPGTILGDDCVVGANSVVHGEFPAGSLVAGAPATVKKSLYPRND